MSKPGRLSVKHCEAQVGSAASLAGRAARREAGHTEDAAEGTRCRMVKKERWLCGKQLSLISSLNNWEVGSGFNRR